MTDQARSAERLAAARRHAQAGDYPAAIAAAREAAAADPRNVEAFAIWGVAAAESGDYPAAAEPLTRAADAMPEGSIGWANLTSQLARTLSNVGFWAEAARRAEAVARRAPPDPMVRERIGAALARINLVERGLEHLEWAAGRTPDWPDLQFELGLAYMALGRLEAAETAFERAIALDPAAPRAHMALADLQRWTPSTAHIDRLTALRARADIDPLDRARLGFPLFKELDDLDRREEAWPVLALANEVSRADAPAWSAEDDEALVDALIETFAAPLRSDPEAEGRQPIFIVGLPRSGTTLVERILAAHSQVTAMGEMPTLPMLLRGASTSPDRRAFNAETVRGARGADWDALGRAYRQEVAFLAGDTRFFVDKLPANSLLVGPIRLAFPGARIIHVRRDPMDSLFSAYKVRFSALYGWSYRLHDMAEHYRNHVRLMAHWREVLGEGLIEVVYEDLVRDPEPQIRRLLDACGLEFEPGALSPHEAQGQVRTASIVQVRRPISAASVGAWRRYAAPLEPLRADLESRGLL